MPLPNVPFDITTLLQPWTQDGVRASMVTALVGMGIRADLWPKGGVAGSVMTDMAGRIAAQANDAIAAIKAGWLPTATGGWLTWVALYFYGITRREATFASGSLTVTNTAGGVYNEAPFTVTFQDSASKKTYVNVDAIALAAGPGPTQTIQIQAVEAGSASNAAPLQIDTVVTSLPGVTCSNAAPVLGIDAQSDEELRQECWDSLGARSVRGPRTAYAFAIQIALNSITQTPVNINRWTVTSSSHKGQVTVVIASPSGVPDANDVTGVATSIEAVARPECVQVTTLAATKLVYSGPVVVYLPPSPGLLQATVAQAVLDAIDAFFVSYPIGGRTADGVTGVHGSGIEGAIAGAFPGIFAVDSPGDLAMTSQQVAVSVISLPDITVRLVTA